MVSIASVAILVGMFVMYYRRRRPLPATEVLVREHGSEVNYDFAMNNTTSGTEYTELDILADVSMDVWDDDEEKVLSLSTQKYLTVE